MSSFRFIGFVTLFATVHSQRIFDGITVMNGDLVHIDFKYNNIWNRIKAGSAVGDPVYYEAGVASRGDRYTWTFTENSGMRFENVYFPGYYLGVFNILTVYYVKLIDSNLNTFGEWTPQQVSGGTMLETSKGCLHKDTGSSFQIDSSCTQTSGKSRKIRIVPRFPCYHATFFDNIVGWYSGLGIDLSTGQWQNMMNTGNDITLAAGEHMAVATHGVSGLPYLKGYVTDVIVFPPALATSDYTAIFLTRYQTTNQGRIIECTASGCAVGHRSGLVGILYQQGTYVTSTTSFDDLRTYLISSVKHGFYRANGYSVPTVIDTGTLGHTAGDQFCINCKAGQSSDFEVYEAIIIDTSLTTSRIQCIEDYVSTRYNVSYESKSPTPVPTPPPTASPTDQPSKAPTTKAPSASPTHAPTSDPTPAPTECLSDIHHVLDTTTLVGWTNGSDGENVWDDVGTFEIEDDPTHTLCYATNPCIKIVGSSDVGVSFIYVEKIFEVSGWNDITIHVEAQTFLLELVANERGIVEVICDAEPPHQTDFNLGLQEHTHYSGCLYYSLTQCDSFTFRIGAEMSGTGDYIWITQINIQYTTSSPTTDPTNAPSAAPSEVPSSAPSNAPTQPPTAAPSVAPSESPTACLDLDPGYNSNDGVNEMDVNDVANSIDFVYDTSMVVDLTDIASSAGTDIYLNETALELQCHGVVSCFQTRIFCAFNQSICNILCDGYLSCSQAIIYAHYTQHVHIICNEQEACLSTQIYARNVSNQVTVDCVSSSSCNAMYMSLNHSGYNLISCYLSNACDDIRIHTPNYNDTKLTVYSHSNNIVLDNGYGLLKSDKDRQIDCATDNKYIRYHSDLTHGDIESRVLNEYSNDLFPCSGVTILCEQNTTDSIDSSCTIAYSIRSITPPMSAPQCYWISITDLVTIHCPGTCLNSPTATPTKAPSFSPTQPTLIPTTAPSNAPTDSPSIAPTQPPTVSPSATPTLAPSLSPTQPPTWTPSLAPTLTPSLTPTEPPTQRPSFAPSHNPTNAPSHNPSTAPTLSPTVSPSNHPTGVPSQTPTKAPILSPTVAPSLSPSDHPSAAPTVAPSTSPSLSPSDNPTNVPSRNPTGAPTISPTAVPSSAPSHYPSNDPSQNPTTAPTMAPTVSPSLAPSRYPTDDPSQNPTTAPTLAPSLAPTIAPTTAPTIAPTFSPTQAPTRGPTVNTDLLFWVDIIYELRDYTEGNLHFMVNDSVGFVERMQSICEMHYFPVVSSYTGFVVEINAVNDVKVVRGEEDAEERRRMAQEEDSLQEEKTGLSIALEIDDLYSFQLQQPIQLTSQVFAENINIAGSIITRSKAPGFSKAVQNDIRSYFSNDEITFNIDNVDALHALDELPPPPEETNWTVIVLSIVVVSAGLITSMAAFAANKKKTSAVDNASFLAPLLVGLQIYDLISDVNLGFSILAKDEVVPSASNPYFLCGIGILFFTVLPFVSNLYYAMTLPQQKVIRQNAAAATYFKNRLTEFVLIVVFTGGCYPGLALVSSRIFGLDAFNCGLTKYELNKLSKIKIRSTITLENGPQLVLQIIYASYAGVDDATIMAFTASLLSVIATLAAFYAQSSSDKSENNTVVQYALYLCFKDRSQILTDDENASIRQRKERKAQLSRAICSLFQFPQESIEIGYIKIVSDGYVMNMVHYVFEEQLNKYQKGQLKMNALHQSVRGLNLQIEPIFYVQHLCMDHHDQLTTVMCNHFRLDNAKRFMVKFVNDDTDEDYFKASHQELLRFGQTNPMNMGRLPISTAHHQLLSSSYSNMKRNDINNAKDEQKENVAEMELMPISPAAALPAHTSDKIQPSDSSVSRIQSILSMQSKRMLQIQKQTELQMSLLQQETQLQISEIVQLMQTDEGDTPGDNQGATNQDVGE